MTKKNDCECHTYYLFDGQARCLHKLFRAGAVKILVRQKTYNGVEFYIYADKPKEKSAAWKRGWWKNGRRSKLHSKEQILLAIELAEKHQVKKVRL